MFKGAAYRRNYRYHRPPKRTTKWYGSPRRVRGFIGIPASIDLGYGFLLISNTTFVDEDDDPTAALSMVGSITGQLGVDARFGLPVNAQARRNPSSVSTVVN